LIEHNYAGNKLSRSIIGVGININEEQFDTSLPNPISMHQLTGVVYDRVAILELYHKKFMSLYSRLELGEKNALEREYISNMYRLGQAHPFKYPNGTTVEATIEGVLPSGELMLLHADGSRGEYLFKEIEFVIASKS